MDIKKIELVLAQKTISENNKKVLIKLLEKADKIWFESEQSLISDDLYDRLVKRLGYVSKYGRTKVAEAVEKVKVSARSGDTSSYPEDKVTGSVDHEHWFTELLGTLSKCTTGQQVVDKIGNTNHLIASIKADGNAVALTFAGKTGVCIDATSRGKDGKGKNLLHIFKGFRIDPRKTTNPAGIEKIAIKYEAVVTWEDLDKYNELVDKGVIQGRNYASPRSFITAILAKDDPTGFVEYIKLVPLDFVVDGDELPNRIARIKWMSEMHAGAKWCFKMPFTKISNTGSSINVFAKKIIDKRDRDILAIQIDGIVLEIGEEKLRKGWTSGSPNYATALKFPPQNKETVCTGVRFDQGKTGRITPVINFEPVVINGHEYTNVSLASYKRWKSLGEIGVGTKLLFTLRHDVLGYVEKLHDDMQPKKVKVINFIEDCPCCGEKLEENKSGNLIYCVNEDCESNIIGKGVRFLKKIGVKGIEDATLRSLHEHGYYADLKSLVDWNYHPELLDGAMDLDGFGKTSISKIIKALNKVIDKPIKDYNLFNAISIEGLGSDRFKEFFKVVNFEEFCEHTIKNPTAPLGQIINNYLEMKIPSWGKINITKLINGIDANREVIQYVLSKVQVEATFGTSTIDVSEIKTVCITGSCNAMPRKDITKKMKDLGHKVAGKVSKNTDYLITDDTGTGSGKLKDAANLGTPILTSEQAVKQFDL